MNRSLTPDGVMPTLPGDDIFWDKTGSRAASDIALATVMMLLATGSILARLYARRLRKAQILADDITLIIALLFTYGTALCVWIGASKGGLGQHEPIDVTTDYPVLTERLRIFLEIDWVSLITGSISIGLTKISVLLMYRRIFQTRTQSILFSIILWTLLTLSAVWTVAFTFGNMFECKKFKWNWVAYGGTPEQCIHEDPMYRSQAFSDITLDALILMVPIPMIVSLQLSTRQKVAVVGMFLLGGVTITVSIYKAVLWHHMYQQLEALDNDLTWLLTPQVTLNLVEAAIGICGACLPLLKPIFDDKLPIASYFSSLTSTVKSRSTTSNAKSHSTPQRSMDDSETMHAETKNLYGIDCDEKSPTEFAETTRDGHL